MKVTDFIYALFRKKEWKWGTRIEIEARDLEHAIRDGIAACNVTGYLVILKGINCDLACRLCKGNQEAHNYAEQLDWRPRDVLRLHGLDDRLFHPVGIDVIQISDGQPTRVTRVRHYASEVKRRPDAKAP